MKYPLRWSVRRTPGDAWVAQAWSRSSETSYRCVPSGLVTVRLFGTSAEAWRWLRSEAAAVVARNTARYGQPLDAFEAAAIDPDVPEADRVTLLDALLERDYG